jgi:squalene-hopene/tetraprenyl-beta-curcumene cyclase
MILLYSCCSVDSRKGSQDVGDWKFKNPNGRPGGWYFEYANELYPDTDDTFQVLTALSRIQFPDEADQQRKREAMIAPLTGY